MFRFKQFCIEDNVSSMKVGTDAVLLGSVAEAPKEISEPDEMRILDIGTGCGVVALMLAQRYGKARIDAIDIDEASTRQASENFKQSPWSDRLIAIHGDIRNYESEWRYDLIVANPPYFTKSLHGPSERRNRARHDDNLTTDELTQAATRLLDGNGSFWVILPPDATERLVQAAAQASLYCHRRIDLSDAADGQVKRSLTEIRKWPPLPSPCVCREVLRDGNGDRSEWHKKVTKEFYL